MPERKYEILGVALGIIGVTLLTVGGVSIQALDKSVPLFQMNAMRLIGKTLSIYCSLKFEKKNVFLLRFFFNVLLFCMRQGRYKSTLRPPHWVLKVYQLPSIHCCFFAICICIKLSQTYSLIQMHIATKQHCMGGN